MAVAAHLCPQCGDPIAGPALTRACQTRHTQPQTYAQRRANWHAKLKPRRKGTTMFESCIKAVFELILSFLAATLAAAGLNNFGVSHGGYWGTVLAVFPICVAINICSGRD